VDLGKTHTAARKTEHLDLYLERPTNAENRTRHLSKHFELTKKPTTRNIFERSPWRIFF